MELKHVITDVEKTFGNLEYAGEGSVKQKFINGKLTITSRRYNLYSDIQRAYDIRFKSKMNAPVQENKKEKELINLGGY